MSGPSRSSRMGRVLHDELDDAKPPALHRRYTVNPQEANGVLMTAEQPSHCQQRSTDDAAAPRRTIQPPSKDPRPGPPMIRPALRIGGRRLALEETIEPNLDVRPVQPPERKPRDESHSLTFPQATGDMKPPAFVRCPKRRSLRSNADGSVSPAAVPVPPPLTYSQTMHTSNTTMAATATTLATPPFPGRSNNLLGSELSLPVGKPCPKNSQLQKTQKPPHPWAVLQLQQDFPLMPIEASSLEEEASSRSNSLRTRSTMDTLELVLAQRYPVNGEIPLQYHRDLDNYQINGGTSDPVHRHLLPNQNHSELSDVQKNGMSYSESMIQLLLDEQRRQAGGYISQDLDVYINSQPNVDEADIIGQPSTTSSSNCWDWNDYNRNIPHGDLEYGETDTVGGDASLSTVPDPPSLRVRDHIALRPGADRKSVV